MGDAISKSINDLSENVLQLARNTGNAVNDPAPTYQYYNNLNGFVDQNNQPFSDNNIRGEHTIVGFVFTECGFQCPNMARFTRKLQEELTKQQVETDQQQPLNIVFHSIDPTTDRQSEIQAFLERFDLNKPVTINGKEHKPSVTVNFITRSGDYLSNHSDLFHDFSHNTALKPRNTSATDKRYTHAPELFLISPDGKREAGSLINVPDSSQGQDISESVKETMKILNNKLPASNAQSSNISLPSKQSVGRAA